MTKWDEARTSRKPSGGVAKLSCLPPHRVGRRHRKVSVGQTLRPTGEFAEWREARNDRDVKRRRKSLEVVETRPVKVRIF
jgi:hypothetical protein